MCLQLHPRKICRPDQHWGPVSPRPHPITSWGLTNIWGHVPLDPTQEKIGGLTNIWDHVHPSRPHPVELR